MLIRTGRNGWTIVSLMGLAFAGRDRREVVERAFRYAQRVRRMK